MNRCALLTALACVVLLSSSCGRPEPGGPPSIRLGRDQCAGCGMIISESRCSCAMRVSGEPDALLFDDLGCLLDYREDHADALAGETFVRDYAGAGWTSAGAASYLAADPRVLDTPMGSGFAAFGVRGSADAERGRSGGEVVSFERLAEVRREWRQARRSLAEGAR